MTTTPLAPAETLRGLCDDRVHLPGDPGYDSARLPWNLVVDQRPAAVALPRSVEEVVDVVRAAFLAGLRVVPQSTGHGAGPLADQDLGDAVLLRLSELTGVTVDPEQRTARVVGGTVWQQVVEAAHEHGLAALHGSAPDVAVAGYVLGGGLSFYGRRHGLAANGVRAVELVLPDGRLVRATEDEHPDLLWAVRGGGGGVGVVVALEIDLLPYADVVAGMLLWDVSHAPAVVARWAEWTRTVPDTVTTSLRLMQFPPLPELPPFLSGRHLVVVDGAVLEDDERAAELLAPLRALAPEMDTFGRVPVPVVTQIHMDPPEPSPAVGGDALLGDLPPEAVAALLGIAGPGTTSSLMFAEVRHLGGALRDPASGPATVDAEYLLHGIAIAPFPEAAVAGLADCDRLLAALAPWTVPGRLLTFVDRRTSAEEAYGAGWARLREVRAAVDPAGRLVSPHAP